MKRYRVTLAAVLAGLALFTGLSARAEVEWEVVRNLELPSPPVDIAASGDGQKIFVLLPAGELRIYDAAGREQEVLRLDRTADRIVASPDGSLVIVSDSAGKQVRLVSLDYVESIAIAGSPVKGPNDAKVVVAVYSDFQ